jgi:hypothetical protein
MPTGRGRSLGGDKGFDSADFVNELRSMKVTPHWRRTPAIDTRPSQRIRKRIEEVRLDQDGGRTGEDEVSRRGSRRMGLPKLLAEAG